jgi:hypothetical protein
LRRHLGKDLLTRWPGGTGFHLWSYLTKITLEELVERNEIDDGVDFSLILVDRFALRRAVYKINSDSNFTLLHGSAGGGDGSYPTNSGAFDRFDQWRSGKVA